MATMNYCPMDGSKVIFAAHRGDKKRYPENTMPAFIAANDAGVDMIETDIHMTLDGELVIMHDRSALRTAGVDKFIDQMTLEEVKTLDVGYATTFGEQFKGTSVPTVREFIEWVSKTNLDVNWELKDYPGILGDDRAFTSADKLIALIEEYGMRERSMVNSFSSRVLEHIIQGHGHTYPVHGQGIFNAPKTLDIPEMQLKDMFDWCCLYPNEKGKYAVDYPENFDYCEKNNILSCVCIPDEVELYSKALKYGCRMFTSNDIITCEKVLRQLGAR